MAIDNKQVKDIYKKLSDLGADVGTEDEFNDYFFAPGDEGYQDRLQVWKDLKSVGEDVGDNYEAWSDRLGIHAVERPAQQPQQQTAGQQQTTTAVTPPANVADSARDNTLTEQSPADAVRQQAQQQTAPPPKDGTDNQDEILYQHYAQAYNDAAQGGATAFSSTRDLAAKQTYADDDSDLNERILTRTRQAERRYLNEKAGQIAADMVRQMADHSYDRRENLRNVYYSDETRQAIEDMRAKSGIHDYNVLMDTFIKPQLERVVQTRWGLTDAQAKDIVGGIASKAEDTQRIAEGRKEYAAVQQFIEPSVNKYINDFEAGMDEMLRAKREVRDDASAAFIPSSGKVAKGISDKLETPAAMDAEQVWQGLSKEMENIVSDLIGNEEFMAYMQQQADKAGARSGADYFYDNIYPSLASRVEQKFTETEVARNMPKSDLEDILSRFHNSVTGMLMDMGKSQRQRDIEIQARELTAMGQNPDVKPKWWKDIVAVVPEMAPDFWMWGMGGKLGGQAAKQLMKEQVAAFAARRGVTEAVAARYLAEAASKHLPTRIRQNLLSSMASMGIMMGSVESATEVVRGAHAGEDAGDILMNAVESGVTGLRHGAELGGVIGYANSLTGHLRKMKKVLGKTAAFGAEAGTMYGQQVAAQYAAGEGLPDDPGTGFARSALNLLAIKASGNLGHTAQRAYDFLRAPKTSIRDWYNHPSARGVLTDTDRKYLEGKEGLELIDAINQMRPAAYTQDVDALAKGEGYVASGMTEAQMRKAERKYNDFMERKDIPLETKQHVAYLTGGPAPEYKATRAEVDGTTVRTYSADGHLVEEKEFNFMQDAEAYAAKDAGARDKNLTAEQASQINDIDAAARYSEHIVGLYQTALQKAQAAQAETQQGQQRRKGGNLRDRKKGNRRQKPNEPVLDLTDEEQRAVVLASNFQVINNAFAKLERGEQLTPQEQQLLGEYNAGLQQYAKSGRAGEQYTAQYEQDNGLRAGDVNKAIQGHTEAEARQLQPDGDLVDVGDGVFRTQGEQQIVEQYRQTAQEYIDSKRQVEAVEETADKAREDGYDIEDAEEQNDSKNAVQIARERLAGIIGEERMSQFEQNPVGALQYAMEHEDWSPEDIQAGLDYIEAKNRFDGIIDHVREDMEQQVQTVRQEINGRIHQDGQIHPATMKGGDPNKPGKQVYILSGDVRMTADNSAIDVDNSSKDIIVMDPETGKPRMISVDELASVETIDAQQELAEAEQSVRQEVSKAAADKIDGALPFQVNDRYDVKDETGADHQVTILADNGDGTVMVSVDGGEPTPALKEQLQEMKDRSSMERTRGKLGVNDNQQDQQEQEPASTDQLIQQPAVASTEGQRPAEETGDGAAVIQQQTERSETTEQPIRENETEPMPMVGEGDEAQPDFLATTPKRGQRFLYEESGFDEADANEFVDANIAAADEALKTVSAQKPKMGTDFAKSRREQAEWRQQVEQAQKASDYWHSVKEERKRAVSEAEQQKVMEEMEAEQQTVEPVVEEQPVTTPVAGSQREAVAIAEAETNTAPTEAQKQAGNYKKGHVKIDGYDITIENPKGSERSGKDASGKPWSVTMNNTYGYIRGTEGKDGDHIDVFLSDDLDGWNGKVFVIDQVKKDGTFDEHKVMYGFNTAEEARAAYLSNYSAGWKGLGNITGVSKEEFRKWTNSSHRKTKPFAEYKSVKVEEGQPATRMADANQSNKISSRLRTSQEKYQAYLNEQDTVNDIGGLVRDEVSERSLSPYWAGALHDLARRTGRRIVVLSGEDAARRQGKGVRGYYMGSDKTVYLNEKYCADDKKMRSFVLGHELTHALSDDNAELWKAFKVSVKAALGDQWQSIYDETRKRYDAGIDGINKGRKDGDKLKYLDDDQLMDEIACDWAGDHMLTDVDAIRRVVENSENAGSDPVTLTQKVLQWIREKIQGLTHAAQQGDDVEEELTEMQKAEKLWQDMYNISVAKHNQRTEEITRKTGEGNARLSIRPYGPDGKQKEPAETRDAYKLMRLTPEGNLQTLFIGRENYELGTWYNADSPDMSSLENLAQDHFYLFDADNNVIGSKPIKYGKKDRIGGLSKKEVENANANGQRWMAVGRYANGKRKYANMGINGAEGVTDYALRPGIHAGSLPVMTQIGSGPERNLRDDNLVWVKGKIAYGNGAPEEALANGGEINDHVPEDGGYEKGTSSFVTKGMSWYISGAFKPERIISDQEARDVIDDFNQNIKDADADDVPYDFPRRGGRMFNAETMRLEDPVKASAQRIVDNPETAVEELGKIRQPETRASVINQAIDQAMAKIAGTEGVEREQAQRLQNDMVQQRRSLVQENRGDRTVDQGARYSLDTTANQLGMRYVKGEDGKSHFYYDRGMDKDGNPVLGDEIKEFKPEHIDRSPVGAVLRQGVKDGVISQQQGLRTLEQQATIMNYMKNTPDLDMFFAVSGAIGFAQMPGGAKEHQRDYYRINSKGKIAFVPYKSNSETQYDTTFDVTTICRKTQTMIDAMSETMKGLKHGLTVSEIIKTVYDNVYKEGKGRNKDGHDIMVPCNVCYVFNRWVNLGNLFDTMRRLRDQYDGMDVEQIKAEREKVIEDLCAHYKATGEGKLFNTYREYLDARDEYKALMDAGNKEDAKVVKERLDAFTKKKGALKTAMEKRQKAIANEVDKLNFKIFNYEKAEDKTAAEKPTPEDYERLEVLRRERNYLDKGTWFDYVRLQEGYQPIPDEVLFDINKSFEFKEKYPGACKYRTTRGSGMGKAAAAYSPEFFGSGIVGRASDPDTARDMSKNLFLAREQDADGNWHYTNIDEDTWELKPDAKVLLRKARDKAAAQNYNSGQRFQSTSDARVEYLTDYNTYMLEQMAMGAKAQGFTKVPECSKFFGDTGAMFNMSLIARGKGYEDLTEEQYNALSDEDKRDCAKIDGVWRHALYSDVSGINHGDAFALNDAYPNLQPIMVGLNRTHLRLCMALASKGRITFNIPYHASGDTPENFISKSRTVGEDIDLASYDDYTKVEVDQVKDPKDKQAELARNVFTKIKSGADFTEKEMAYLRSLPKDNVIRQLYMRFRGEDVDGGEAQILNKYLLPEDRGENGYGTVDHQCRIEAWDENTGETLLDENGNPVLKAVTMGTAQAGLLMPNDYWDKTLTLKDADRNGNAFVELCDQLGLYPRFGGWYKPTSKSKFKYDPDKDFTKDPGYWSTLIDISMYDLDGNPYYQKAVDASQIGTQHFDPEEMVRLGDRKLTAMEANPDVDSEVMNHIVTKNIKDISTQREQDKSDFAKIVKAWSDDPRKNKGKLFGGKRLEQIPTWIRDSWDSDPSFVAEIGKLAGLSPEQLDAVTRSNVEQAGIDAARTAEEYLGSRYSFADNTGITAEENQAIEEYLEANDDPRYAFGVPYQGSKNRIAKKIIDRLPEGERFVDLMSGGGAMTHAAMKSGKYGRYHMNDKNPVGQRLFMEGVTGKWHDYDRTGMTDDEFKAIKGTPEALAWSYNGLGRNLAKVDKNGRDKAAEQIRRVKKLEALKDQAGNIDTSETDYRAVMLRPGDVVYADIPYESTDQRGYGKDRFNKQAFVEWAQAQDVPIYVSEYTMPEGWTEIDAYDVPGMKGGRRQEKLWVQSKFADQEPDVDAAAQPLRTEKGGEQVRFTLGDPRETFRERQEKAVDEKGVVMAGLNNAVVNVTKDIPRHPYTGGIEEATAQAIKAAKKLYAPNGEPKPLYYDNYGRKFQYSISGRAIKTLLSAEHQGMSSDKGGHLALAEHIDKVIGNSIEIEEHPDRIKTEGVRGNDRINPDALMHRFIGVARINGTDYTVESLLQEDGREGEGNGVHSYVAQEIKVLDIKTPNTSNGVDTPNSELEAYPLTNLIKNFVKAMEPDKNLLKESAKLDKQDNNGDEQENGDNVSDSVGLNFGTGSNDGYMTLPRVKKFVQSLRVPERITSMPQAVSWTYKTLGWIRGALNHLYGEKGSQDFSSGLLSSDSTNGRKMNTDKAQYSSARVNQYLDFVQPKLYEARDNSTSDEVRKFFEDQIDECNYARQWYERAAEGDTTILDEEMPRFSFSPDDGATDPDAEGYDAGNMPLDEMISKGLIDLAQKNKDNVQLRIRAMQSIGGNLQKLRQAMALQRDYDRKTVDSIVRLSRLMMGSGIYKAFSPYEVSRLMGMVNRAAGREDITKEADKVVDLMVTHQLKELDAMLGKQLRTKASKLNSSGVEVQAGLDIEGQRMMQAMRESMDMGDKAFADYIAGVQDRMASDDQVTADNAAQEWQGVQLAQQYRDEIKRSKDEEKALRQEIRQAEEGLKGQIEAAKRLGLSNEADLRRAHKEYLKETERAIRENKLARVDGYLRLLEALGGNINASRERAKEWRDQEKARVEEIWHNANSDLAGLSAAAHGQPTDAMRRMNNSLAGSILSPLATFDYMLRFLGQRAVDGRGYLWRRFMMQNMKASDSEWRNVKAAHDTLDAKVSEVMGDKMRWSDLFDMEKKMPGMDVSFWDNGNRVTHTLTQGNMLYIYMVNKMADGRMKLRRMGITEEDVEHIKENIDPRFIQLADWLQGEYLVNKRKDYNEVYERMFGAPMAAIEDYFPLKVNARSRTQQVDINEETFRTEARLGSTVTGSVIKRIKNTLDLDVTGADAFDVVLEHIQDMEHWRAYAEMNRDLNTLLSYRTFRNKVMNMGSWRFGSGKELWDEFMKTCAISTGAYRPKVSKLDKGITTIAKGVSAAKVSFRLYTALKQLTSYPAYFSEASAAELAKSSNPKGMADAWKWAMENLPGFTKRWQSRQAGDTRLAKTEGDMAFLSKKTWLLGGHSIDQLSSVGMTPNAFVDAVTVAIGSKAVYETKYKRYVKEGYTEEKAKELALLDAWSSYNATQQSSEGAFTSAMQLDRTVQSTTLSIFRNSPMGYGRRYVQALSNLRRKAKEDYKKDSIDFMAKQMERDGLTEEQAQHAAERAYNRSWWQDLANLAIFGFGLQFTWALAPDMPYLAFGDDEKKKEDMMKEAALTAFTGPIEGLAGGNAFADFLNSLRRGEGVKQSLSGDLLPLWSDMAQMGIHADSDPVRAVNDLVGIAIQSGAGFDPKSVSDIVVAALDACNGDFGTAREVLFFLMRFASIPQSQLDEVYLDELGMNAREASQMDVAKLARRYAQYKTRRDAPLTGWMRSEGSRMDAEDKYIKKFMEKYKERVMQGGDPDVNEILEEYKDGEYKEQEKVSKRLKRMHEDNPTAARQAYGEWSRSPEGRRFRIWGEFKSRIDKARKTGNYKEMDRLRARLATRLQETYEQEQKQ